MSMHASSGRGRGPQFRFDREWLALHDEEVLEPQLPIVDPHHHLWDRGCPYFVPELLEDLRCGHQIRGTVYVEAASMYRADGDPLWACLGEVEYANGVAAEFASGRYGEVRACAGIVGRADLLQGAAVREVLQASMARAPERYRGIRFMTAWDPHPEVSRMSVPQPPHVLADPRFREGFAQLGPLGLSFDAWMYHPQLPELLDLVDAFPDTCVVINHVGGRIGEGPYAGRQDEVFRDWKASMRALGRRPQVFVKLGGLNVHLANFGFADRVRPPTSAELEAAWRPYVETCIEAFGPERAMFESNFPPDKGSCSARVLWNAFKRLAAGCSDREKHALFAGTAIRAYRLPASLGESLA